MLGTSKVIFLDQLHWCSLAAGNEPAVLAELTAGVRAARLVLPLSVVQYWETWHRREWRSRHQLAGLMRDLSQYRTFAAIDRIFEEELTHALHRRLDLPAKPVTAIGWGVRHAFDHPVGRMRLMNPGDDDGGPGAAPYPEFRRILALLGPFGFEWLSLAGPDVDFGDLPAEFGENPIDVGMRHRDGDAHVKRQHELRAHLTGHAPPGRFADALRLEWIMTLLPRLETIAARIGVDLRNVMDPPPSGLSWVVDEVPTASVWFELDLRLLRDPGYVWDQHDLNDQFSLAIATAHSDVVVTERHWAHHLRQTSFAKANGVIILHKLTELLEYL